MLYCVARCYAGTAQVSLTVSALTQDKEKKKKVHRVGFEPTHPKIKDLKTFALDRSAIGAINCN
jgi:hypothetical protein